MSVKRIPREKPKAKLDFREDEVLVEALGEACYEEAQLPGAIKRFLPELRDSIKQVEPARLRGYPWVTMTRANRTGWKQGYPPRVARDGDAQTSMGALVRPRPVFGGFIRDFSGE